MAPLHPFGIFYTATESTTSTTSTTTPPWTLAPASPTSASVDWDEVFHSDYTKHYSDYYQWATTTPTEALLPTVTATLTVTGANIQATPTATGAAYDHSDGDDHSHRALGSGAIAGIVVGSVVGVGILGALLVWFCLSRRRQQQQQQTHKDGEVGADEMSPAAPASASQNAQGPASMTTAAAAAAAAAHDGRRSPLPGPSTRLPSPFRHRSMGNNMEEETVAFAKASSTAPSRSTTTTTNDEDPPAYEETEGHHHGGASAAGASRSNAHDIIAPEMAACTVSDGFRRYDDEPPVVHADAESKPYDVLGPRS